MGQSPAANADSIAFRLFVPAAVVAAMIDHAREHFPEECCGLLSGVERQVRSVFRLHNEAPDPRTGFLTTAGLVAPFQLMRQTGEELLAIYHSHPASPAVPSGKDLALNYYPDAVHVIISLAEPTATVRAYVLSASDFLEVEIAIL